MMILLVEDSDDLRRMFARSLKKKGLQIVEATDGQEALDRLGSLRPDLILTDYMMPRLDGLGLLKRLRAMPGLEAVPVVFISAMQSAALETEARVAGAADFINKPVDSDDLIKRVARYL